MQTQSSDGNSVCLSVKRMDCDKTEEICIYIIISYERTFIPVFWEGEWLVGGDPFYLKKGPRWSESADFLNSQSLVASQP